jgi:hypothetical protein
MAARTRATRAKLAHDTSQTLSPVTGTEGFALLGHTQDVEFFGGRRIHIGKGSAYPVPESPRCCTAQEFYLFACLEVDTLAKTKGTGTVLACAINAH